MSNEFEMPDPKAIEAILDVVSKKVPELLKELSNVLYSPEQAKQFSLSAAKFYNELKAAGMTDEQAFELTNKYMSTLNLADTMKDIGHHGQGFAHGHGHGMHGVKN